MTIADVKTILVNQNSVRANQEIVEQIISENPRREVEHSEIHVFDMGETLVFLSEQGLTVPNRVIFVDLKSKESFLQELE